MGWDPVADADLVGYRIYDGSSSGAYTRQRDVGLETSATIEVANCRRSYVAVKARDAAGNLSEEFSNEISGFPRPEIALVAPPATEPGLQSDVFISGVNFVEGAAVRFGSAGIQVVSASVRSCMEIQARIAVAPGASVGPTSVEVRNPDGSFGAADALFSILSAGSPSVLATSPPSMATGIAPDVRPTVTFTEPMRTSTFTQATVRLADSEGRSVEQAPGSPFAGAGDTTVTIVPASELAPGRTYRIVVEGGAPGVLDAAGLPMADRYVQVPGFTTRSPGGFEISDLDVTPQARSAEVAWTTTEPADGWVHYRSDAEADYRTAPMPSALATEHFVQLADLVPLTRYSFFVESTNAGGDTVRSAEQTFDTRPYSYLRVEAEVGGVTLPLRVRAGTDAFRGASVEAPSGAPRGTSEAPAGFARLDFHVPVNDTWLVWARLYGQDPSSDSWFVSIDGAPREPLHSATNSGWSWTLHRGYSLTQGQHVLEVGGYDTRARADRFVITNDPDYVPVREPGLDVTPPEEPVSLVAVNDGDAVVLSWRNPLSDGVRVVATYRTDGRFPSSPADGALAGGALATPLLRGSLRHEVPGPGTYWYGVFALDPYGNASDAARIRVTH